MKAFSTTNMNKYSDKALVAATKRGDARAFEELVLRYRQSVSAAQRTTNNREDAGAAQQRALLHLDLYPRRVTVLDLADAHR
jgi:hypothetical protein